MRTAAGGKIIHYHFDSKHKWSSINGLIFVIARIFVLVLSRDTSSTAFNYCPRLTALAEKDVYVSPSQILPLPKALPWISKFQRKWIETRIITDSPEEKRLKCSMSSEIRNLVLKSLRHNLKRVSPKEAKATRRKGWKRSFKMGLPRTSCVKLNRLWTGVGRFHSSIYKWGLARSANCECGATDTRCWLNTTTASIKSHRFFRMPLDTRKKKLKKCVVFLL